MKAIVFDFDGVIVLSEKAKFNFLQNTANELGINFPNDLFEKMIGLTTKVFFQKYLNNENPHKLDELLKIYEKNYKGKILDYIEPINLTIEFIRSYKGDLKLAVVSGSDLSILIEALRSYFILEKFEFLISKEDVSKYKPDPEPYLLASKRLNVMPEEMYVVEDTFVGAQSAVSAGASCYILLNSLNVKEQFKDVNIKGFIENPTDFSNLK